MTEKDITEWDWILYNFFMSTVSFVFYFPSMLLVHFTDLKYECISWHFANKTKSYDTRC